MCKQALAFVVVVSAVVQALPARADGTITGLTLSLPAIKTCVAETVTVNGTGECASFFRQLRRRPKSPRPVAPRPSRKIPRYVSSHILEAWDLQGRSRRRLPPPAPGERNGADGFRPLGRVPMSDLRRRICSFRRQIRPLSFCRPRSFPTLYRLRGAALNDHGESPPITARGYAGDDWGQSPFTNVVAPVISGVTSSW